VLGGTPIALKAKGRPMSGTGKCHRCDVAQVPPCWSHSESRWEQSPQREDSDLL